MLPANYNRKLGYYQLGNEEYEYATEAILAAKNSDRFVEFKFNNDFFSKVKWHIEPDQSLAELYLARVKQLREQYDYLILSYSGGSDSWTILHTFLTNKIKLDEIVIFAPLEATKNLEINPLNFEYANTWQEYKLNIEKDLKFLAQHHPEIKISVSDFTAKGKNFAIKDAWQERATASLLTTVTDKYFPPNLTDSSVKYNNIGYIVGLEKPKVCYRDNKFYIYFLDYVSHLVYESEAASNNFWTVECFYWAPESEKILRKQAHIIKTFFQKNPQMLPYISWPPTINPRYVQLYESVIKSLIYPNWDLTKWQADKPLAGRMLLGYETPLLYHDSKLGEIYSAQKKEFLDIVEKKYISKNQHITGFVSDFYEI